MDFTKILQELEEASLFDLYRLGAAIGDELRNPQKLEKVKKSLTVGQEITWFDNTTNRLQRAVVQKCSPTRCEVENTESGEKWRVPYSSINIDDVDTSIQASKKFGVKKSVLRVGDIVSFKDNENKLQFAKVLKLNPKTAGLITMEGIKWRVYYENLSINMDIDADIIKEKKLEYEEWLKNNGDLLKDSHTDIL